MADIIVPVVKIEKVDPHKDADSLEIVEVGGWQVVVRKDSVKIGDMVVHFPPQAMLPLELSDALGVTKYLSKQRVKAVKLRGETSHGFVAPVSELQEFALEDIEDEERRTEIMLEFEEGNNLMDLLEVTKYEPPIRIKSGDAEVEVDEFPKYTSIENLRNHQKVFEDGEEVVVTEKVHGTNSRIGLINGEMFAGSKGVRRKPPQTPDGEPLVGFDGYKHHTYWFPWSIDAVQEMMAGIYEDDTVESVILYGEIYGAKIQKLDYGVGKGNLGYVAFDIKINGEFLPYEQFTELCDQYGVPRVPELDRVKFEYDLVKSYADGGTMLEGDHIREGVVVKPLVEGRDPKIGRRILKFVSSDYLAGEDMDSVDDQA